MEVSILSGKCEVLDTNIVYLFDAGDELTFNVKATNAFSFRIILKFNKTDDGKRNFSMVPENNVLTFCCTNFDAIGAGTVEPLEVATVGTKKIFFHFWAFQPSETTRKVEYTIYAKEEGAKE